MNTHRIIVAVLFCLFTSGSLLAQGKYLNPAAEREMDKPIITASSTLPPGSTSNYSPDNLMDGTAASWSEGKKGSGVGEYLQVDFRFPDEMKYVMIKNGFGKEKYWKANARIKRMKITNEEGEARVIKLKDTPDLQIVGLNHMEIKEDIGMVASGGLYGSSFKFEILEVYPGERWQDACITEINFNQWYTDWFPMTNEYIIKNLFGVFFEGIFDDGGTLYVESDWDGYVDLAVNPHVFEEIVSGDGTSGHEEYHIFLNHEMNEYILLSSVYMKQLDYEHIDFNEEVQEDPVWSESFSWQFEKYESFDDAFIPMDTSDFKDLFDVNPIQILRTEAGEKLSYEDIWLTMDDPGFLKIVYPPSLSETKSEALYEWDGKSFRLQGKAYSPDFP